MKPKWRLIHELKYRRRAVSLSLAKVQDILKDEGDHITMFLNEEGVIAHGTTRYAFVTVQILQKLGEVQ